MFSDHLIDWWKTKVVPLFLTETKHSSLNILRRQAPGPEDILHILNFRHFGSKTTLGAKTQSLWAFQWNWRLVVRKWRWTEEGNLSSKYRSIPNGQLFVSRSSAHYLLYVCTTYIIKYRLYYPLCIYHILDSSPTVVCGKLKVSVDDVSHGTEVRSHLQCPTPSLAFELSLIVLLLSLIVSNFAWRILKQQYYNIIINWGPLIPAVPDPFLCLWALKLCLENLKLQYYNIIIIWGPLTPALDQTCRWQSNKFQKEIGTLSNKLGRKAFGQSEIFVLIIVHLFLAGRQGEKDGDDEDHCTTDKLWMEEGLTNTMQITKRVIEEQYRNIFPFFSYFLIFERLFHPKSRNKVQT